MAEVQRCWPSGQTDSGRHYREQGERRERKMKKTDDAHFKPTHKHGIKSIRCCGSTHNRTACEFCTHARFPCKMHETHNKTCQKIWAEPHMLFHFVSRAGGWRKSEPLGRSTEPSFRFPRVWWRVCDRGLSFAVFWREVTVLLNPKHLKYLRPRPCSTLKEQPVHLDPSQCMKNPGITFA